MLRRTFITTGLALAPTAALAQTWHFLRQGLGNALLLETTVSSTNQQFFSVIEQEGCTPNAADNNCWILLESNAP